LAHLIVVAIVALLRVVGLLRNRMYPGGRPVYLQPLHKSPEEPLCPKVRIIPEILNGGLVGFHWMKKGGMVGQMMNKSARLRLLVRVGLFLQVHLKPLEHQMFLRMATDLSNQDKASLYLFGNNHSLLSALLHCGVMVAALPFDAVGLWT
jgi:hypothetical protein